MIVGSDGVFDNLYLDEVTALANIALPPSNSTQPRGVRHRKAQEVRVSEGTGV